jgi:hypothetical protein
MHAAMALGVQLNANYRGVYRSYIRWYDEYMAEIAMVDDDDFEEGVNVRRLESYVPVHDDNSGTVYITQSNVEMYFALVVVNSPVSGKATVRKKISALNRLLLNVENSTAAAITYSPAILLCISEQHLGHLSYAQTANAGTDPHKGLKDVYSDDEVVRIVSTMWRLKADTNLLFSYTWGKNAGVRGASSRAMVLCDLNVSYGFGPEIASPRNRTLLLVLRKGSVHKDKHTTDKQVGVQRHRDYKQCTVFSTAALVVTKLRALGDRINFLHVNDKERAYWWDIPLNEFKNYSSESSEMKQVLNVAGIDVKSGKLTHHRTQAVQVAGSSGLRPDQVCTMTKHVQDKYHSAYMPEVEEETMRVMSGFRKYETRFVPTEHVVFPGEHSKYLEDGINWLIPEYRRYIEEYYSDLGDKSQAATKFLFHVVPYLVETLLQAGYYFIHDFPLHPLTALLRVSTKLPGSLLVLYY